MDDTRPESDKPGRIHTDETSRLFAAKSALERVLCRSGKEHWPAFAYDSEKGRETACLSRWASEEDCWFDSSSIADWKGGPGMGEHDIVMHGDRVWKSTKGGKFGIYFYCSGRVMGDPRRQIKKTKGTPHQYLSRLALLNEWRRGLSGLSGIGDLNRLEGVATLDDEFSIITSQPMFPHDEDQPAPAEIEAWLRGMDFKPVTAGIFYRGRDNLGLFDVKPSNAIRSGGVIVPLDVIPIRPHGLMQTLLREAADR